ncbi:protein-export chaperone SecB [Caulobacter sp. FWC2]|uniref:protein-export chaperone SecB n=1 Tax=Caulobacter sp. FWC2 TaxID=69664 RepID=UPI000C1487FC|nr:protein-export chaperone SecB [Caulobacter sp. FWC2]PIB94407.1 protein-export chaperone SecB [Caulobacter sp. FWC2]
MTDTTAPNGAPEATSDDNAVAQSGIRILAQFVRDFSFENPLAPDSLRAGAAQPQIDMGVEMNARGRPDGLFEVDLKLSARALRDEQAVFHVEVVYGGLFHIEGVPEADLEPVLLIECPRFLFPYARRLISDVTAEGGFPPFLIDPIDFAGVYAARKAQAEGQVAGNA